MNIYYSAQGPKLGIAKGERIMAGKCHGITGISQKHYCTTGKVLNLCFDDGQSASHY
jgi:hypothetical protein